MCTLTWLYYDDGYQMFFNRDEKRTRLKATPPRPAMRDGVRYLAPVDGDQGGTWIAVNHFGVTLCLLNGANLSGEEHPVTALRSRGLLLLDLISADSIRAVRERLTGGAVLSAYGTFTLGVFEPRRAPALFEWNGAGLEEAADPTVHLPLASSSFDAVGARRARTAEFSAMTQANSEAHLGFHRSHGPSPSAYSTCMHRADAETVSFSAIRVAKDAAEFLYADGAPCVTRTERFLLTPLSYP